MRPTHCGSTGRSTRSRSPWQATAADAYYQQALALAKELGMRPLQAHCHLALGTLSTKRGQLAQARVELSTAIELFHMMGMTFWLPRAQATLSTGRIQPPAEQIVHVALTCIPLQ